jgi:hypothetical protein
MCSPTEAATVGAHPDERIIDPLPSEGKAVLAQRLFIEKIGQRLLCARPRAQIHRVGLGRFTGSMRNTVCYEIVAN